MQAPPQPQPGEELLPQKKEMASEEGPPRASPPLPLIHKHNSQNFESVYLCHNLKYKPTTKDHQPLEEISYLSQEAPLPYLKMTKIDREKRKKQNKTI